MILDCVRQGEEVVAWGGNVPIFNQSVVQMTVEGLLNIRHILHLGYATNADLLPFVKVCLSNRHCYVQRVEYHATTMCCVQMRCLYTNLTVKIIESN